MDYTQEARLAIMKQVGVVRDFSAKLDKAQKAYQDELLKLKGMASADIKGANLNEVLASVRMLMGEWAEKYGLAE